MQTDLEEIDGVIFATVCLDHLRARQESRDHYLVSTRNHKVSETVSLLSGSRERHLAAQFHWKEICFLHRWSCFAHISCAGNQHLSSDFTISQTRQKTCSASVNELRCSGTYLCTEQAIRTKISPCTTEEASRRPPQQRIVLVSRGKRCIHFQNGARARKWMDYDFDADLIITGIVAVNLHDHFGLPVRVVALPGLVSCLRCLYGGSAGETL
jgi:hypothetical protein